ncbi:MAG: endonuclease Q family protein, partial [Patescibacteria group bacterium]
PIIGLSALALAELCWEADKDFFVFPAHVWTPWFSIFGSKSGFDSIEECFGTASSKKIFALETGLSSDPAMNHLLSGLDQIALLSNSDAHSLNNLGREANIFDFGAGELSFKSLVEAIKSNDREKFLATIEFFPEEGKYHIDGHAACGFSCRPDESAKNNNRCPRCGKPLVLGVLNRVNALADRRECDWEKFRPFYSLIPLQEIIADALGVGKNSKKVLAEYLRLTGQQPEFSILLDLPASDLKQLAAADIADGIIKVRAGQVDIEPGYDGVFGRVSIKKSAARPPTALV